MSLRETFLQFLRGKRAEQKDKLERMIVDLIDEEQKQCSECFSFIDARARRCPYCTVILIA